MEITEYIAWQVFETEEKVADMKTTSVNGITTNSGALTLVSSSYNGGQKSLERLWKTFLPHP